jgi:excisionase family DNA binding protein
MSANAYQVDDVGPRRHVHVDDGRSATADDVLTVNEVATLLHLSARTVAEYGARGILPSVKIGRHRRFSRRQLDALMATAGGNAESKPATRNARGPSTV